MNKKGLNEIISLVLFILLILALIAVLYYYISPSVRSGGKQLEPAAACLKAQVEPVSCTYATCEIDPTNPSIWVAARVRRNAANVNISDIRYVVTDSQGRTFIKDHKKIVNIFPEPFPGPNEYVLKGIPITPLPTGFVPKTLTVTPIVGTGADRVVCDTITRTIDCTPANSPAGRCANCDGSTVSPRLNANDFQCFMNSFSNGSSYGDFNEDSLRNVEDFMGYCIAWNANDCSSCPPSPGVLTC